MSTARINGLAEVNPHLALGLSESYESKGERAWFRFVNKVERLIGRVEQPNGSGGLDGDEGDGFSLDAAHDAFSWGWTAEQYVAAVRKHGTRWAEEG